MRLALTRPHRTARAAAMAIAVCAAALAGCTTHPAQPISAAALKAALAFKEYTVYWAGLTVDGVHLTDADSPLYFYSPVGFTMYYGDCEGRGALHDGGCTVPLKITTSIYSAHSDVSFGPQRWVSLHGVPAVIYNGGDSIEIYSRHSVIDIVGDSPARTMAGAAALYPFNRTPTASFPAFPQPLYTPNPPPAGVSGTTGPTGPTGATTAIAPPSTLEPAP